LPRRCAADWAEIDGILREHDVAISVVDGGIHGATDAITRFRLNALAVFAEFERDMIGERLRDTRAARRARGLRVAGRLPLGYAADRATKQLVVVPAEAVIVRSMFADADAGALPLPLSRLGVPEVADPRERDRGALAEALRDAVSRGQRADAHHLRARRAAAARS
jgi:hypothetical protein